VGENGYRLRQATAEDLETLARHRRLMMIDMGNADGPGMDAMIERFKPWALAEMAANRYSTWLALEPGGEAAAGAALWLKERHPGLRGPSPRVGYVLNVFCERAHRRRGLARLLVETIVEHCRELGLDSVELHASDEGRPLYESMGFAATNEMRLPIG
jgi:GNAT superfamily N-acetyltransferase